MTTPTKGTCEPDPQYGKDELKQLHFYCQFCGEEMGYDEIRICHTPAPQECRNKYHVPNCQGQCLPPHPATTEGMREREKEVYKKWKNEHGDVTYIHGTFEKNDNHSSLAGTAPEWWVRNYVESRLLSFIEAELEKQREELRLDYLLGKEYWIKDARTALIDELEKEIEGMEIKEIDEALGKYANLSRILDDGKGFEEYRRIKNETLSDILTLLTKLRGK